LETIDIDAVAANRFFELVSRTGRGVQTLRGNAYARTKPT